MADNPLGTKCYDNKKAFSLSPYVASLKMISSKSDCVHIFNVFPNVYSPGAGAETLNGNNSDVSIKALSLCPFVAK